MIWVDGRIVPDGTPVFAADDRGVLLGDGLFETLKAVQGRPLFSDEHLARMGQAAALLDLPFDEGAARDGVAAVLAEAGPLASVRITLTRGPGPRGLAPVPREAQRPRLVVSSAPAVPPSPDPVRVSLALTRRNEHAASSGMKSLSYADMLAARAEAAAAGAQDALVLNSAGRLACTTIGNLWVRLEEGWVTPPLAEGVLPGIVRAKLLAAGAGRERPVTLEEARGAPLCRSNSLVGVQRLRWDAAAPGDNPLGALYEEIEREHLA